MISRRPDHSLSRLLKSTIAAQIHFLTALLAIAGLVLLLPVASRLGPEHFWGTLLFGLTALLVFGVSATYHFVSDGYEVEPALEEFMERLDHWAIYLFIAGSYTPFLINVIASPWKEILLVAIWAMAIIGILYTAFRERLPRWAQSRFVYTLVFVLMGWTLIVRIGEVWARLPATGMTLLLGGAASYSIGAVVYATKRPKLFAGVFGFHELWHVFVSVGYLLHYAMIRAFYL
jgi:hemolysin III